MKEYQKFLLLIGTFLFAYLVPFNEPSVQLALKEAFTMLNEYAREHVLFCLVPAFFIAGGISTFISQASVVKYLGATANKFLSYGVASISGSFLAVCSCTILPLFGGIYKRGAGIGPASAFLYSGPAINVLAIVLTARVLGPEIGIARAVGAILFSIIIGLLMAFFFRKEEAETREQRLSNDFGSQEEDNTDGNRSLWQNGLWFLVMVLILVFAAWGKPKEDPNIVTDIVTQFWLFVHSIHWYLTLPLLVGLAYILISWFKKSELKDWVGETWKFTKQITPLLFGGVLVAGFLMGNPLTSDDGLIPPSVIGDLVGGNSLLANVFAVVSGALWYFSTLTEVPILQSLMKNGMGNGPALGLLLAGPALSLPNMLVIRSIMGTKKTLVYIVLVIVMATISGLIFGTLFPNPM